MSSVVALERRNAVSVITVDSPPVKRVESRGSERPLPMRSAKPLADLRDREHRTPLQGPHLHRRRGTSREFGKAARKEPLLGAVIEGVRR